MTDLQNQTILLVVTSHGELGETGQKTGFWLEEVASPYYEFTEAGSEVQLASPQGGEPPMDPNSQQEQRAKSSPPSATALSLWFPPQARGGSR